MGWNSQGALNFFKDRDLRREKEEERALERENALFALTLESMKAQNKYLTGEKYTAAIDANKILRKNIMEADLTAEDLAFYEPVLADPFLSKYVEDFRKAGKKEGLEISYSMVPTMLDVIPSNAPESEKIDFIERITGADLSGEKGKETYRKLATEIISAPTEIKSAFIISPKPGVNLNIEAKDKYQKAQREKLIAQLEPLLDLKIRSDSKTKPASDPNLSALIVLQKDLKAGGDRANRAFQTLLPMFFTEESFEALLQAFPTDFIGAKENPYLPNVFPENLD